MDPIESWVDPQEVRRLAEALMTPSARAQTSSEDATYSQDFVGFAQGQQAASIPAVMPSPAPVAVSTPSASLPSASTLGESLRQFRVSLPATLPIKSLFVLQSDASAVYDDGDHRHLYFLASPLAQAGKNPLSPSTHMILRAGSADFLELIAVESSAGRLVLALLVPTVLSAADISYLAESHKNFLAKSPT
jgi:hypothetical protein